jgi:SAM-dependent methyltransferase
MAMGRTRIVFANWYDYPQYYDIAFQANTQREGDFIEAACRKYCPFATRRLLEPACGTGRLITELANRGYELSGFDLSQPALRYLRRRLARFRLYAEIFDAEMSNFRIGQPADAAYCMINTFRYLLTERAARSHLECLACSLRPGGIYILGLHLLPLGVEKEEFNCWTQRRSEVEVRVAVRVLRTDRRQRIEDVQLCLNARRGPKELHLQHAFQLRTYTARQFRRLLDSVPSLEVCDVYDYQYDIAQPFAPNNEMAYSVFVLRRRCCFS